MRPLVLTLLVASAAAAQDLPPGLTKVGTVEGIAEYKLANGVQVLLLPDASQPKVTVNCTIFVGSRHEGYGETGMAHLLEHMVFKGSPKFPNVPKALRDHGADFNGTTWLDRTNYYETMPATDDNLEFGLELEADRLVNSFIAREELLKEFSVVRSEFEAGENDPERVLSQRMVATAFEWHNYGKSTIGNRTDIERVKIESLQAFYKKYYRPSNVMLIVAGKFDTTKALALVAKHFGPLKNPAEPLPQTYTEEPPQDGERLVTLRRVGTVGAVGAVYHLPAAAHPDFAACEILSQVLLTEPSGRLYKALVESKKASAVSGTALPLHDPGMLEVTAQTTPEQTDAARAALIDTLEKLAEAPVTDEEVARAKVKLAQGLERLLANSQRFAVGLSNFAGAGSWKLFFLSRDRIAAVTAADVNRVAKQYLVRSNRTVGVYIPTKTAERASIPETPDVAKLVENYKGRTALATGEAFDPTPANVEARVKRGTVGEGVRYAVLPKKTRGETVTLTVNLRYGNLDSLKGQTATADLLGPVLLRGTTTKTRQQIEDELDTLNATLRLSGTPGLLTVNLQTKKKNLAGALAILADVLRNPSFPAAEFEIVKRESLENSLKGTTEPQILASTEFRRKLNPYPKDDARYTPTLEETIETEKNVTLEQVKALYDGQLGGAAGELAVVGDFDPESTLKQIDGILKGWVNKVPYKRMPREYKPVAAGTQTIVTPDKANALFIGGTSLNVSDSDPEYAALVLGNYLLGAAPLASRLSNRVRGEEGLSYGIGSQFQASSTDKVAALVIFAICNPKNMPKVDAAIMEEVKKFVGEGVSASELEEAKKAYLQTLKTQRANDGALAGQLAGALQAGRTFEYYADLEKKIEALQPGDIKKAFDKAVDAAKLTVIQAGDLKKSEK